MKNIKKRFPALKNGIYANTAAYGPLHENIFDWRQEHNLDYLIGGGEMIKQAMGKIIPEARTAVARFFNCKNKNVSLVPSFSIGLNLLLEGLDTKHRVLLLENDYPSVNWPFEQRGFITHYASIDEELEERIYKKIKNENITVLALSLVQWLNGIKVDLDFLKNLKSDFPDLLIIADGTQFCGTTVFDFENSGIDVLGASAYKWLLAGSGNGFLLMKDTVEDFFDASVIGFNAANGDIKGKADIRFAKYLEPGHLDTFSFGSLKCALRILEEIGMPKIGEHNKTLAEKAKENFTALGLLETSVVNRKQHSTILNIKGDTGLFHLLMERGIVCSRRGTGIRFAFHFYNTENDIDTITEILKTNRC